MILTFMKNCHSKRVQSGFTMVELMIILVVIAIMVAFAVPSFQDLTKKARTNSMTNQLVNDLAYAKSEALMRSTVVSLLPYSDNADWSAGWCVFVDSIAPNAKNCASIDNTSLLLIEKDAALKSLKVQAIADTMAPTKLAKISFSSDSAVLTQQSDETNLQRTNQSIIFNVQPIAPTSDAYGRTFELQPWGVMTAVE
jgi:prepilin-type N-terminal cleavage/methylation domain-containing protein